MFILSTPDIFIISLLYVYIPILCLTYYFRNYKKIYLTIKKYKIIIKEKGEKYE